MTAIEPDLSRILIYVDLSEEVDYTRLPLELVSSLDVILLGIYPVTDQASPEQTRDSFEEEAREQLRSVVERFSLSDIDPDTELKFTADPTDTMNQIAVEKQCDAILTPGEIDEIDHILLPYKGSEHAETMTAFVSDLLEDSPQKITVLRLLEDGGETSKHRDELETFREVLVSEGVDVDSIRIRLEEVESVEQSLVEEIDQYDLAVLGESERGVDSIVIGSIHEKVLDNTAIPLITVRFPGQEGQDQQMRNGEM